MYTNNYIIDYYKRNSKIPKLTKFTFEDTLETVFKLPPQKALEWLKKKGKNLQITTNWNDLDDKAHDTAFTVSKVISADILQLIYKMIEKAKKEGWTLQKFQKELLPLLKKAGWTGITASRLKVIYDTNMQMAYAKGKYQQQKLISNLYPYWKYTQIQRPTKRHDHSIFHGKVFKADDPIWQYIYPPSSFSCKCSVVPIKDGSNVEDGNNYLSFVQNSKEFQLRPLTAWEPEVDEYVEGIRNALKKMLKK